jgi:hypothetical protein
VAKKHLPFGALVLSLLAAPMYSAGHAGEADVVGVRATEAAAGVWRFDVTVSHADAGWQHYADRWDVVGPDGAVLGSRVLLHPHVDEQPFTRSLSGVAIPAGVDRVRLRAHDSVHDFGGAEMTVELPR